MEPLPKGLPLILKMSSPHQTMGVLTDLLAVRNIRLGDEDILDELVVLLLVSGEHEAAGLQQVRHAVQLEHCQSSLGGAECCPQTQQTKTGLGPLGLKKPRPPAATTASLFNQ